MLAITTTKKFSESIVGLIDAASDIIKISDSRLQPYQRDERPKDYIIR